MSNNINISELHRPIPKMKVKWNGYDCTISKVRYRDKVLKLKPDYEGKKPMPYYYFWVDFNEIFFNKL